MATTRIAKTVEISSESEKSFEDAIVQGIARASKTVKNIRGAWVKEQKVRVEGDRISKYRVMMQVTFELTE